MSSERDNKMRKLGFLLIMEGVAIGSGGCLALMIFPANHPDASPLFVASSGWFFGAVFLITGCVLVGRSSRHGEEITNMTSQHDKTKRWRRRYIDAITLGMVLGVLIIVLWIFTEFRMLNPL